MIDSANHNLAAAHFEALAAGAGGRPAVAALLASERSRRLLLFKAVLAARPVAEGDERLPQVAAGWRLLVRAQQRSTAVVDRMVLHPAVGLWVAHATRLLHGLADDDVPLWVHTGHLSAIAAVAAIRAGLDFDIAVPAWAGAVFLPTAGCARLPMPSAWDVAQVSARAGAVRISGVGATVEIPPDAGRDGPGWDAYRELRVEAGGQVLTVGLEDLDPYRGLTGTVPPQRLPVAAVGQWQSMLQEAWALLVRDHPEQAGELACGLLSVVSAPASPRFRPYSASADDSFGGALVSFPDDPTQLAVTLLHEFGHTKLNGLLHLVSLVEDDGQPRLYAPWRDDPRPLAGLLHGAYAFFAVTEFWRTRRGIDTGPAGDLASYEFALWRLQTDATLRILRSGEPLTPLGRRLVDALAARLQPWLSEPVPAGVAAAARAAAADHRAAWQANHLCPDPRAVAAVTAAWLAGAPAPENLLDGTATLRPQPSARWLDARAALVRLRLIDPAGFAVLHAPEELARQVPGATQADLAYASGDFRTARRLYQQDLATVPDQAWSWPGLGLVLADERAGAAEGAPAAAAMLLRRPELVRAVAREVVAASGVAPPPEKLAAWLAGAATGRPG